MGSGLIRRAVPSIVELNTLGAATDLVSETGHTEGNSWWDVGVECGLSDGRRQGSESKMVGSMNERALASRSDLWRRTSTSAVSRAGGRGKERLTRAPYTYCTSPPRLIS